MRCSTIVPRASSMASTFSFLPRKRRPRPRHMKRATVLSRSASEHCAMRSRMRAPTSPLHVPTNTCPRASDARAASVTSPSPTSPSTTGPSSSCRSSRAVPAYATASPIMAARRTCDERSDTTSVRSAYAGSLSWRTPHELSPVARHAPARMWSSLLEKNLSIELRPSSTSHMRTMPSEAAAASMPSVFCLYTHVFPCSPVMSRSVPNPALTKALTYVLARFSRAESTAAPSALARRRRAPVSARCRL
mmetsp:Transcript_16021/g.54410  ORF Transcript_16021/g.54410 Transcript_16021/m.54410 type:complete len:248 (+) Transcript_16021:1002-1745(+)